MPTEPTPALGAIRERCERALKSFGPDSSMVMSAEMLSTLLATFDAQAARLAAQEAELNALRMQVVDRRDAIDALWSVNRERQRTIGAQAARLAEVEQAHTQQAVLAVALAEGVVMLGRELDLPAEMAWLWKLATSTLDGTAGAVGEGQDDIG